MHLFFLKNHFVCCPPHTQISGISCFHTRKFVCIFVLSLQKCMYAFLCLSHAQFYMNLLFKWICLYEFVLPIYFCVHLLFFHAQVRINFLFPPCASLYACLTFPRSSLYTFLDFPYTNMYAFLRFPYPQICKHFFVFPTFNFVRISLFSQFSSLLAILCFPNAQVCMICFPHAQICTHFSVFPMLKFV
jgi:hypothetical protein